MNGGPLKIILLLVLILGIRPSMEPVVTAEEIKILIDQAAEMGVFGKVEDAIVDQFFRMGAQKTIHISVPRGEIIWLDIKDTLQENLAKMLGSPFSHFPVADGDLDTLRGYVSSSDLLAQTLAAKPIDLRAVVRPPVCIPENSQLFEALQRFRETVEDMPLSSTSTAGCRS